MQFNYYYFHFIYNRNANLKQYIVSVSRRHNDFRWKMHVKLQYLFGATYIPNNNSFLYYYESTYNTYFSIYYKCVLNK